MKILLSIIWSPERKVKMISDEALLKISWVAAITGIAALFFITEFMQAETVKTTDIMDSMIGKPVVLIAKIKSVYQNDNNIFMTLEDEYGTIKAVWFDAKKRPAKNSVVEVTGRVSEYKNELEIIIDDLR